MDEEVLTDSSVSAEAPYISVNQILDRGAPRRSLAHMYENRYRHEVDMAPW